MRTPLVLVLAAILVGGCSREQEKRTSSAENSPAEFGGDPGTALVELLRSVNDRETAIAAAQAADKIPAAVARRLLSRGDLPPKASLDAAVQEADMVPAPLARPLLRGSGSAPEVSSELARIAKLEGLEGLLRERSPFMELLWQREAARKTAARCELSGMETALNAFEVDHGKYPEGSDGLRDLWRAPEGAQKWRPYLRRAIDHDPWGNAYIYECPGRHNAYGFDLSSCGPDGKAGTDDDITNWDGN